MQMIIDHVTEILSQSKKEKKLPPNANINETDPLVLPRFG